MRFYRTCCIVALLLSACSALPEKHSKRSKEQVPPKAAPENSRFSQSGESRRPNSPSALAMQFRQADETGRCNLLAQTLEERLQKSGEVETKFYIDPCQSAHASNASSYTMSVNFQKGDRRLQGYLIQVRYYSLSESVFGDICKAAERESTLCHPENQPVIDRLYAFSPTLAKALTALAREFNDVPAWWVDKQAYREAALAYAKNTGLAMIRNPDIILKLELESPPVPSEKNEVTPVKINESSEFPVLECENKVCLNKLNLQLGWTDLEEIMIKEADNDITYVLMTPSPTKLKLQ